MRRSPRQSLNRPTSPATELSLERLEAREVPAGVLNYTIAGSVYTQNFDTLIATGSASPTDPTTVLPVGIDVAPFNVGAAGSLDGWQIQKSSGSANTAMTAGTGSGTAGGHYSFGATGSTDRALGTLLIHDPGDGV